MVILLTRVTALMIRVLCRKKSSSAYALKLAQDIFTDNSRFLYRYLSSPLNNVCACTLDLLAAIVAVGPALTEFIYENFDFTLRSLTGFPNHHRVSMIEPYTNWNTSTRACFVAFMMGLITHGRYDLKLAVLKINNLFSPILYGLQSDEPQAVLDFLQIVKEHIVCHQVHYSKSLTAAFLAGSNANSLTKLLGYNNPVVKAHALELITQLCSPQSPFNVIYKVDRLGPDEIACIRNRSLQAILGGLNIFQSVDQLQLALMILENCPDLVGPYLRGRNYAFDPEYTVKWLTLCSFYTKVAQMRPPEACEVIKTPSMEYFTSACCPLRTCLNRAVLSDSAIIKLYALQLLSALMRRLEWSLQAWDAEVAACEANAFGTLESARRLELLRQSRSDTIEGLVRLLPDLQTVQNVTTALIAKKELKSDGELDASLLSANWRDELIISGLDCLRLYVKIFIGEQESLEQVHFEDPLKFVSPLLAEESLLPAIFEFSAAFPRFSPADTPSWRQFFPLLCQYKSQNPSAKYVLSAVLYSSGLFCGWERELDKLVDCLTLEVAEKCFLSFLELKKNSIFPQSEHCPLLQQLLQSDLSSFAQSVINYSVTSAENIQMSSDSESSSSDDSSSDDSSDDSDSDEEEKAKRIERVSFDLPDPATSAPSLLLTSLLAHLDKSRLAPFTTSFPTHRKLLTPPPRNRINENMLKDMLFGPDDFLVFCNWLALLASMKDSVPIGSLDVTVVVQSWFLSALVCGLSSEDEAMRRASALIIEWIDEEIRAAVVENDNLVQVYAMLSLLRRSIEVEEKEENNAAKRVKVSQPKIPAISALFVAQTLPILLQPEHALYSVVGSLAHSSAHLRLNQLPLFDKLIRAYEADPEKIVERAAFVKQLCWFLKIAENGCKGAEEAKNGPMAKSRVIETSLTLLPMFTAFCGSFEHIKQDG